MLPSEASPLVLHAWQQVTMQIDQNHLDSPFLMYATSLVFRFFFVAVAISIAVAITIARIVFWYDVIHDIA